MQGPGSSSGEVTLFLGNLQNHLSRDDVMAWIDGMQLEPFYDFLYVPLCLETSTNKGYGFVNFTRAEAAEKFIHAVTNLKSQQCPLTALTVTTSKTQGLKANLARWCRPRARRIRNPSAMPLVKNTPDSDAACIEHHQAAWSHPPNAQGQEHAQSGVKNQSFQAERVHGDVQSQTNQRRLTSSPDVGAVPVQPHGQDPTSRTDDIDDPMFLKSLAKLLVCGRTSIERQPSARNSEKDPTSGMDVIDDLLLLKSLAERPVFERTSIERQPGAKNSRSPYIQGEREKNSAPQLAHCVTPLSPCCGSAGDKGGCADDAIWSAPTRHELPPGFVPTEDTLQSVAPTFGSLPPWQATTVDSLPAAVDISLATEQSLAQAASYLVATSEKARGMTVSL